MKKQTIFLIIVLLLMTIFLSACRPSTYVSYDVGDIDIKWVEVDPPPEVKGPCYLSYFMPSPISAIEFAGIYCKD